MKLLLQKDVFTEDETQDTEAIIKKYFDVQPVKDEDVFLKQKELYESSGHLPFRGSLSLLRVLRKDEKFSNALNWMPPLKQHLLNRKYMFMDLGSIIEFAKDAQHDKIFCRPVSGLKEFSGGVYTIEKLEQESRFLKQSKNIDDTIICVVSPERPIQKEYRCVFINNILVSSCQYMVGGQKVLSTDVPIPIEYKAREVASHDYFANKFEFVLDIADVGNNQAELIEINEFATASFYACDLDKIYGVYAASF